MIKKIYSRFIIILFASIFAIIFLWVIGGSIVTKDLLPPFAQYSEISQKKQAFVQFVTPRVERANLLIDRKRQKLLRLYDLHITDGMTLNDSQWVKTLAIEYKIEDMDMEDESHWVELSKRVDIMPVSMAVSQSAIESAWGTSRFAQEGYNLFGMWCYSEGCGMVPHNRDSSLKHEVKQYGSIQEGVNHFIHTLNSNKVYKEFRNLRYNQRILSEELSGYKLAAGLKKYSQKGQEYIDIVRKVIKDNNLESFEGMYSE